MKNILLILFLIPLNSCEVDNCVVITRKEKTGINFLFFFDDGINRYQSTVDEYGAIPSGAVTEEVYNQ